MPRRTVYYRSTKGCTERFRSSFVKPIKAMIEENPSFGYRTVAHLLASTRTPCSASSSSRAGRFASVRWGSGLASRHCPRWPRRQTSAGPPIVPRLDGRDGWAQALVIDCYSRELLGWHFSRSGRSKTGRGRAGASVDRPVQAVGQSPASVLLRSDNGLVFTSRSYTALVKKLGLQQEFITPYSPEQNGMVERVIRTLKDQCVHRHRFETLQHASRVIAD